MQKIQPASQMKRTRIQFNTRVRSTLFQAVTQVCDRLEWTKDEVAEVALATVLGSQDSLMREKRKRIVEAAKQLEIALTFNPPEFQLAGFVN